MVNSSELEECGKIVRKLVKEVNPKDPAVDPEETAAIVEAAPKLSQDPRIAPALNTPPPPEVLPTDPEEAVDIEEKVADPTTVHHLDPNLDLEPDHNVPEVTLLTLEVAAAPDPAPIEMDILINPLEPQAHQDTTPTVPHLAMEEKKEEKEEPEDLDQTLAPNLPPEEPPVKPKNVTQLDNTLLTKSPSSILIKTTSSKPNVFVIELAIMPQNGITLEFT